MKGQLASLRGERRKLKIAALSPCLPSCCDSLHKHKQASPLPTNKCGSAASNAASQELDTHYLLSTAQDRKFSTANSVVGLSSTSTVNSVPSTSDGLCTDTSNLTSIDQSNSLPLLAFSSRSQKSDYSSKSLLRIRELENEVALLERQLGEKTKSAGQYVKELTDIRIELTQERSALSSLQQSLKRNASAELDQACKVHSLECQELLDTIDRLRIDKKNACDELDKIKLLLKASQLESSTLSGKLSALSSQLEAERNVFSESMQHLRSEVKSGCKRVMELEQALDCCQQEMAGHLTIVEENSHQYKSQITKLQEQVDFLTTELAQARSQLVNKTGLAESLDEQVMKSRQRENEVKKQLKQNEALYQSLSTKFLELKLSHQKRFEQLQAAKEGGRQLTFEFKQERLKNSELKLRTQHTETLLEQECVKRSEAEHKAEILERELDLVKAKYELCKERASSSEAEARKCEHELEEALSHLQQELAHRTQQVLEMDGLLQNLQADTTARRLQLERTLAQRQSELKTRANETEKLLVELTDAKEKENTFLQVIDSLKQKLDDDSYKDILSETIVHITTHPT